MTDARREEQLRIQRLGAAISRKDWHEAEQAYNAIRDHHDRSLGRYEAPPNGVQIYGYATKDMRKGELGVFSFERIA